MTTWFEKHDIRTGLEARAVVLALFNRGMSKSELSLSLQIHPRQLDRYLETPRPEGRPADLAWYSKSNEHRFKRCLHCGDLMVWGRVERRCEDCHAELLAKDFGEKAYLVEKLAHELGHVPSSPRVAKLLSMGKTRANDLIRAVFGDDELTGTQRNQAGPRSLT